MPSSARPPIPTPPWPLALKAESLEAVNSVAFVLVLGVPTRTASPWAANGKIFALTEDGDTFVFEAGPEYQLPHKNSRD